MRYRAAIAIGLVVLLSFAVSADRSRTAEEPAADLQQQALEKQTPNARQKELPLAGETFTVNGAAAFLIPPKATSADRPTPWGWYAPTLPGLPSDAERWMF